MSSSAGEHGVLRHINIPGESENKTLDIATAKALKFSGNTEKTFDGSNEVTITPADLGLSQALKFIGSTTDVMTDGQSNTPTGISAPSIGDVVLSNGNGEFVWLGSNWEELGSENSYALKTVKIVTDVNSGLKGGSDLTGDVTLSTNFGSASNLSATTNAGSSNQVARADHIHGLTNIISNVSFTNTSATFTSNATNQLNGKIVLSSNSYGTTLPSSSAATTGQIYFKLVT